MSTELEQAEVIGRLVGAVSIAESAREAADRLGGYRDSIVRSARSQGVSAARIAALTGLSRPRVYQILNEPPADADWWEHSEFAEHVENLWARAVHEWERHDEQGAPADYFDLGEAVNEA